MKSVLLAVAAVLILLAPTTSYANGEYDPCQGWFANIYNECNEYNHEPTVDTDTHRDDKSASELKILAMGEAPYLIKLPANFYLGVFGGKDLFRTSWDEGWIVGGKVTWTQTVLDFSK